MKNFTLVRLASLVLLSVALAFSQSGVILPDSSLNNAEAPQLSEEEREQLLRGTMVVIAPFLSLPPEGAGVVAGHEIEILETILREAARFRSPGMSRILLGLMEAPSPSVRATTLHWLVARSDVMQQALAMAFEDSSALVQLVSEQILLERGVTPRDIKDLKAAEGRSEVSRRLGVLLGGSSSAASGYSRPDR